MPITTKDAPDGKSKSTKADETAPATEAPTAEKTTATTTSSKREAAVYVANQSGITTLDGEMFQFRSGVTHVTADDPAYKAHPELFTAVAGRARPVVEKATSAPGEKRGET